MAKKTHKTPTHHAHSLHGHTTRVAAVAHHGHKKTGTTHHAAPGMHGQMRDTLLHGSAIDPFKHKGEARQRRSGKV